ncbi:MAG: phosphonate metabolism transcriptional regulator PhnF [Chromatiales bacterium]|nr:phosphonate metabolism transcriptional regulator PhnF [Gammaproteobacteria bacterium]MBW6477143.1 phosphonate metabolism transcriptional regulator PhnF [Chromatiales bacterium]
MNLYVVDRDSGLALYVQIARQLENLVLSQYAPGSRLPAEAELAQRFCVNRHTLRRAVDELVDVGLLERRHGLGVFVLDTQLDYRIDQATRFTENISALGFMSENRILRKQALPAIRGVAQRLDIMEGEMVHWIETLRLVEQRPMCLISHFVSTKKFPDLSERFVDASLHTLLREGYGCTLRRSESLVTAVLPQGEDAKLLGMPQNRPVLRVKSVNVNDRDGTPVEYAITRFRADRIQLRINP